MFQKPLEEAITNRILVSSTKLLHKSLEVSPEVNKKVIGHLGKMSVECSQKPVILQGQTAALSHLPNGSHICPCTSFSTATIPVRALTTSCLHLCQWLM